MPLEEFDYHNKKMGCLLKESMDEVFFPWSVSKSCNIV